MRGAGTLGTPSTLRQAIKNGLAEAGNLKGDELAAEIQDHVRDFLAQKFTIAIGLARDTDIELQMRRLYDMLTKG